MPIELEFKHYMTEARRRYEYSSTQANLPSKLAEKIIRWGKNNIPHEDIFRDPADASFGRETEMHVTLLYGLLDSSPDEFREFFADHPPFEVSLGKISVFDTNPQFDVVKIEAKGDGLIKMNRLLRSNFRYHAKFPTYRPHVTIAYTRKGKGSEYAGDDAFDGQTFDVKEIVFSSRNGSKFVLPLSE